MVGSKSGPVRGEDDPWDAGPETTPAGKGYRGTKGAVLTEEEVRTQL